MRKKRLIFDSDEIIVRCWDKWLRRYNEEFNDDVELGDVTEWDFQPGLIKPEALRGEGIHKYLRQAGFFRDLQFNPGALEGLRELHDTGRYDIVVCTATRAEEGAKDKLHVFNEHLKFLGGRNLFLGHKKEWLQAADVIVDDGPHNIRNFRQMRAEMAAEWGVPGPKAHVLTIAYQYNECVKDLCDLRAESWKDPGAAWAAIVKYIKENV